MVSYSPDASKVIIYFGSGQTKNSCDYYAARWVQVGHEDPLETGAVLALDVADVDGDGFVDVAVSYEKTSKRVYFGKESYTEGAPACAGDPGNRDGWLAAPAVLFGPASQAAWEITSLELVDLNLDGNIDVCSTRGTCQALPSASRTPRWAGPRRSPHSSATRTSSPSRSAACARSTSRWAPPAPRSPRSTITKVEVDVGEPDHVHKNAGTTNLECRNPADDFFTVGTRIYSTSTSPSSRAPRRTSRSASCSIRSARSPAPLLLPRPTGPSILQCSYEVDLQRLPVK